MNHTASVVLGTSLTIASGLPAVAGAPEVLLTNAQLRVRLYLPDAATGFYRGTRFDWSGVIGSLEYAGHEFYPLWFQRTDPAVHDFIYDGTDIVAGPCTAITGPAEEFTANGQPLGFEEAKPGGTFVKIGVGVLRRPDARGYDPYRLYPVVDGGRWSVKSRADAVEFSQAVSDAGTGYGYEYRKIVSLEGNEARLRIDHVLRNTGRRVIDTSVYNHNFLYLDRRAPGPGLVLTVPFPMRAEPALDPATAEIRGRQLFLKKTLAGEERVYTVITGFGAEAADYDFRVEDQEAGVGVRITGDRPLARVALWAIRAPHSIEPFVHMRIEPGAEFTWALRYEYQQVPGKQPAPPGPAR